MEIYSVYCMVDENVTVLFCVIIPSIVDAKILFCACHTVLSLAFFRRFNIKAVGTNYGFSERMLVTKRLKKQSKNCSFPLLCFMIHRSALGDLTDKKKHTHTHTSTSQGFGMCVILKLVLY